VGGGRAESPESAATVSRESARAQERIGSLLLFGPYPGAGQSRLGGPGLVGAGHDPAEKPGRGRGRRGRGQCGQATKGVWGMSWRQEAKKGVEHCEKPGGAVHER
jgi:hypothetical protein